MDGDRTLRRKILLLAGDTDGNLGDLAIVTATIDEIRRFDPAAQISMVTSRSKRDIDRLAILPIRRGALGIPALVRAARDADLVVCAGGGLFQDDDSLVKMPYWALRLSFIRLFSRRIVGLSIGVGPLNYRISRFFARLALANLGPIAVRDELARRVVEPLTHQLIDVMPDPAFLLRSSNTDQAGQLLHDNGVPIGEKPLIGVSLRRCFHTQSNLIPHKYLHKLRLGRGRGRKPMSLYVRRIADVLDEVIERADAHVVFLPTYVVGHENDSDVCRRISRFMMSDSKTLIEVSDPRQYMALASHLSVMLAGRMHSAILAASAGVPIVGLAYNQKFFGTFAHLGLTDRCIAVTDVVGNEPNRELTAMLLQSVACPRHERPRTDLLQKRTREHIDALMSTIAINDSATVVQETR